MRKEIVRMFGKYPVRVIEKNGEALISNEALAHILGCKDPHELDDLFRSPKATAKKVKAIKRGMSKKGEIFLTELLKESENLLIDKQKG
jgi:prophage antirepressor-like protein